MNTFESTVGEVFMRSTACVLFIENTEGNREIYAALRGPEEPTELAAEVMAELFIYFSKQSFINFEVLRERVDDLLDSPLYSKQIA